MVAVTKYIDILGYSKIIAARTHNIIYLLYNIYAFYIIFIIIIVNYLTPQEYIKLVYDNFSSFQTKQKLNYHSDLPTATSVTVACAQKREVFAARAKYYIYRFEVVRYLYNIINPNRTLVGTKTRNSIPRSPSIPHVERVLHLLHLLEKTRLKYFAVWCNTYTRK